jgi:hypothetical protein
MLIIILWLRMAYMHPFISYYSGLTDSWIVVLANDDSRSKLHHTVYIRKVARSSDDHHQIV